MLWRKILFVLQGMTHDDDECILCECTRMRHFIITNNYTQIYHSFSLLSVYQHALDLLGDSPKMSQVYSALGMIAYKLGDMEEAKTQLFDG